MQLKNWDSDIAPPFAPLKGTKLIVPISLEGYIFQLFSDFRDFKIQGIPIWGSSTSLSVQFTCMYYNSNDPVESLFCRQQGGVQAPRIQLFEIGMSIFFYCFFFAGDIYS